MSSMHPRSSAFGRAQTHARAVDGLRHLRHAAAVAALMIVTSTTATAQSVTWQKIADEWRSFTVSGTQRVRYGSGSTWIERMVTGTGQCTNTFFGRDPLVGVTKQCQVASGTTPPQVTAPTIASFSALPGSIIAGNSATLSWSVTNATSVSIDGIGTVSGSNRTVSPSQTTTYTLRAANTAGTTTRATTVTVSPASAPPPATSASRAVPNNTTPTSWRFCSQQYTGNGCQFDGMHQVRFGDGTTWVIKKVMHQLYGFECSSSYFGRDPAPGRSKYCEVALQREEGTLAVPTTCFNEADGCTAIDLSRIPLGSEGHSTQRIQAGAEAPRYAGDGGSFRTLCEFSHMAFDDPIVYPNQPGRSHLHAFFGNTGADAYSTPESIAGTGNSTCGGGTANRTAYWIPALIDTRIGAPIVPDFTIWYYKTVPIPAYPLTRTQALPTGLRMISGDMHATGPQSMTDWGCFGRGGSGASIPTHCAAGEYVEMRVRFPNCWDGRNLDSADHKSHMAFSRGAEGCPSSHPIPVPQITLNVRYLVRDTQDPQHWRLSSDHMGRASGLSAHADWFDGWVPSVRDTWVENCSKRANDCGTDNLGNGTRLY